jgi:hypothetical protein
MQKQPASDVLTPGPGPRPKVPSALRVSGKSRCDGGAVKLTVAI